MRVEDALRKQIEKYTLEASKLTQHEALAKYKLAYDKAMELHNDFTIRACATNIGAMYISFGTREKAKKGLTYLKEAKPPDDRADGMSNGDLFFNMGLAYDIMHKLRKATFHFEKAFAEYEKERDNPVMVIMTLKKLVQVSKARKKHQEVVKWYQYLENILHNQGKFRKQLHVLTMIDRITYQRIHDFENGKSDKDLVDCCSLIDRIPINETKPFIQVRLLVKVAVLLTQFKKMNDAYDCLMKARNLFEEQEKDSLDYAVVLQNLGTLCNYFSRWEDSLECHTGAADLYHRYSLNLLTRHQTIPPQAAKRCQGHCRANHAYALMKLNKLDSARQEFLLALELAKETDDSDSKWQMSEALGAVHLHLALQDYKLPHPCTADKKIILTESRLEHVQKSLDYYNSALKDPTLLHKQNFHDRVLKKFCQVKCFRKQSQRSATMV